MDTLGQQRRVIITSAMLVMALGVAAGIERGEELPSARFLIGCGVAYTICSAMVDLGSPMGAGFAALILVSSVFYQGPDAIKLITQRQKKGASQAPTRKEKRQAFRAAQQSPAGTGIGIGSGGSFSNQFYLLGRLDNG